MNPTPGTDDAALTPPDGRLCLSYGVCLFAPGIVGLEMLVQEGKWLAGVLTLVLGPIATVTFPSSATPSGQRRALRAAMIGLIVAAGLSAHLWVADAETRPATMVAVIPVFWVAPMLVRRFFGVSPLVAWRALDYLVALILLIGIAFTGPFHTLWDMAYPIAVYGLFLPWFAVAIIRRDIRALATRRGAKPL